MARQRVLAIVVAAIVMLGTAPGASGSGPGGARSPWLWGPPHRWAERPPTGGRLDPRLRRLIASAGEQSHRGAAPVDVAVLLTRATARPQIERTITGAGGRLLGARDRLVEASVPAAALDELARLPGVRDVRPARLEVARAQTVGAGVGILGADVWQVAGVTGGGVRVGVIDSFGAVDQVLGTEIPATTQFRCYTAIGVFSSSPATCAAADDPAGQPPGSASHGTAVAETIADVAPGVQLYLADPASWVDTFNTIDWMAAQGVRILNASFGAPTFEGPGDGTYAEPFSMYAVVDYAVQRGILWVNSAGNSGRSTWSGPFVADPADPDWLDFSPGMTGDRVRLAAGEELRAALRWADSWTTPQADYGLYIFTSGGTLSLDGADEVQGPGVPPTESLDFTAPAAGWYELAVRRNSGPALPLDLMIYPEDLSIWTPTPSLPSPADSRNPGEITVGAVKVGSPTTLEPYSSIGPTLDGRIKPDVVAPDCAATVTYPTFCGTSQAAPYATGAAALLLAANPGLGTPAQLAAALRSFTQPLGLPNPKTGYGRVSLGPPPSGLNDPLSISVSPINLAPGGTAQITVTVRDASGTPAPDGTLVTMRTAGAGTVVGPSNKSSATTAGGVATFTYMAPPTSDLEIVLALAGPPWSGLARSALLIVGTGIGPPAPTTPPTPSAFTFTVGRPAALTQETAPGGTFALQFSDDLHAWSTVGTYVADATGYATIPLTFTRNGWLRTVTPTSRPSLPVSVLVRQTVAVRPIASTPRRILRGTSVTFSATVRPLPAGTVTFVIYRASAGRWLADTSRTARTDATGIARLTWRFTTAGAWQVRAVANPTTTNIASVPATSVTLLVR